MEDTTTFKELPDFSTITETPLTRASTEQMSVLYTRYSLARSHSCGKDVLEAACGAGMGLGYLAEVARSVTAGDIDAGNCNLAKRTYVGRPAIVIEQFDAMRLPYPNETFDVVILFEALYYLPDADLFLREARRVLRPGGELLISSVNCEWGGFNPSPYSTRYFTADELGRKLLENGFRHELLVGFRESEGGAASKAVQFVKRLAVKLKLIPKTMKGKELLKRIVFGPLAPIPAELQQGDARCGELYRTQEILKRSRYKMFYAIASKE